MMRVGFSMILQTLTTEAATVLNHSIAEAGRRNHNQTTPLHVAATLLSSPTGFLRQACIRSHPNSSHPLQCRALELCFSVALDRLPSGTSSPAATEPPVSNALMAALKRAQAHQRRGCPEQQQQPLLAVKVELEQLIISILDDPSVSRVMREAGFSSPAVKATIEQSINNNSCSSSNNMNNNFNNFSGGNHTIFRPATANAYPVPIPINRNLYCNPKLQRIDETKTGEFQFVLQQKQGNSIYSRTDDAINRVIEIMSKSKKRNPILVGEFETESIKKEILTRILNGELSPEKELGFNNADVISVEIPPERLNIPAKIKELRELICNEGGYRRVVLDLGDLKWLVEQPPGTTVGGDVGRESVAEMGKLVAEFTAEVGCVWLIGTASCDTYLRCQVYHPSMENEWDLQPLPVSSRSFFSGRTNAVFGSSVESLNSFNYGAQMQPQPCCRKCLHDYEQELVKLNAKSNLPQWLQNAKAEKSETEIEHESESNPARRSPVNDQELLKKWSDICSRIHRNRNLIPSFARMVNPNLLSCQTGQRLEAPSSPVRTDLVLGPKEVHDDLPVKDYLGCISSELRANGDKSSKGIFVNSMDTDSLKKLLKGLMKVAWWQPEAASTIATTVARCSKGTAWLVFAGPDRVGKRKMASVLAKHVCGTDPITICLGSRRDEDETGSGFRGRTVLDRIVDAVRRNPFSLIVLLDVDEADMLVRGRLKEAMERGRFTDSHGREVSVRNIMFVLTGNWSTTVNTNNGDEMVNNKWLHPPSTGDWGLKLTIHEKRLKRRADWLSEINMSPKQPKKVRSSLSLDLNLAVDAEEERTDTSDLTVEQGVETPHCPLTLASAPHELVGPSDVVVIFKPVQFGLIRHEIEKTIKNTFSSVFDEKLSVETDDATLDNIVSALWFEGTTLEDWAEQVLVPSFHKLVGHLPSSTEDLVVRLESGLDLDKTNHVEDRLRSEINVVVDTV